MFVSYRTFPNKCHIFSDIKYDLNYIYCIIYFGCINSLDLALNFSDSSFHTSCDLTVKSLHQYRANYALHLFKLGISLAIRAHDFLSTFS